MAQATGLDLAVFTAGGLSLLELLQNVRYSDDVATRDGSSIKRTAVSEQPQKKQGRINTGIFNTATGTTRISHLHVSAFSIDGQSYLGPPSKILSGEFSHQCQHSHGAHGAGDFWAAPQVIKRADSFRGQLWIPNEATENALRLIGADFHNVVSNAAALAALKMIVSMTINAVAVTFDMRLTGMEFTANEGDGQVFGVTLVGDPPLGAGTYPTAPTGTTSLMEQVYNQVTTALAFDLTNIAAGGVQYTGNMVWDSARFAIRDGDLYQEEYAWLTSGAVTATNN